MAAPAPLICCTSFVLAVACTTCGAGEGEGCVTGTMRPYKTLRTGFAHQARIDAARAPRRVLDLFKSLDDDGRRVLDQALTEIHSVWCDGDGTLAQAAVAIENGCCTAPEEYHAMLDVLIPVAVRHTSVGLVDLEGDLLSELP